MNTERPKLTMKLADLPGWIERLIDDVENPKFNYSTAEIANALRHMLKTLAETPQDGLWSDAANAGFRDAFYDIAELVGIKGAQPLSPREVYETQIRPRIAALTALTRQPVAGDGMATCKGPLQISEATGRVDLFETARKVARLGEHGSDGDESYDELASEIDQEILAAAYEREEVDREVRGSRIFYFRHNPPNTWLAQIFNSILLANGTYEVDHAKHAAREEAARSQLGVLAAAPAATPTDGGEG